MEIGPVIVKNVSGNVIGGLTRGTKVVNREILSKRVFGFIRKF